MPRKPAEPRYHHATIVRVWQGQFGEFSPDECWAPPVNVFRTAKSLEVYVDLAGVEPRAIDVVLAPGLLTIRGERHSPQPKRDAGESIHIVSMEIDHGPFCREIPLPHNVVLNRTHTEYDRGMLRISLPLRKGQ